MESEPDRAETVIRNWGPEEITICIARDASCSWDSVDDHGCCPLRTV